MNVDKQLFNQALELSKTLVSVQDTVVDIDTLKDAIANICLIPKYNRIDRDLLLRELESLVNIKIDIFKVLENRERRMPWLNDQRSKIDWAFWNRYKKQIKRKLPIDVVNSIDEVTDKILDSLFNPDIDATVDKYGLVVGQVQSGKTSNYTGLICKAADAGYKIIIVLAGIHNNLRSQTQMRIDEGFLGFDTSGKGRFNRSLNDPIAHSLTTSKNNGDFVTSAFNSLGINFGTSEPIIAIVKKNASVLKRLSDWLYTHTIDTYDGSKIVDKTLLLIDDEADNASININDSGEDPTRINQLIREILGLFKKRAYVGYTATPFANIFIPIEGDQLFPKDFIINLKAPSNYIGPRQLFGIGMSEDDTDEEPLPIINIVKDNDSKDYSSNENLPESLKIAIQCFILTCAIRILRGQEEVDNSMLVHVSRYISEQKTITDLVKDYFTDLRQSLEYGDAAQIEMFRKLFEEDYSYTDNDQQPLLSYKSYKSVSLEVQQASYVPDTQIKIHEWHEVSQLLYKAAAKIEIITINGGSKDVLEYHDRKKGFSAIVIGGDKLSRGLTLEGLSISYFLRESKMYDTLMQMGRWFGYRKGYVDLCRLFTTYQLNEWFCHITLASEELRDEFDYMTSIAGATPSEYALKIRKHPNILKISALNKISNAVDVTISWSGRLVETYQLSKKRECVQVNLRAALNLANDLFSIDSNPAKYIDSNIWKNKIHVNIIKKFLASVILPEHSYHISPLRILNYIEKCEKYGELSTWSVGLMSKKETSNRYILDNNVSIGYFERRDAKDRQDENTFFIKKNHIISPKDQFVDLDFPDVFNEYQLDSNKIIIPDIVVKEEYHYKRPKRNHPLLLIYFLDPIHIVPMETDLPFIGFAIAFPDSKSNVSVKYTINKDLLDKLDR